MIEGCLGRLARSHNIVLKIHNDEKGSMPAALATLQNQWFFF